MVNVVVLTGRLTRDPELRRANTGNSVCSFNIAVDRNFKSPGQPEADFINCVCFGKTADNLCQYQRKGALIAVTGSIQTRSYDDANGQRRYVTEVVANRIDWLETRAQAAAHQNGGYNQGGYGNGGYGQGGYDSYGGYNQGGYGQSQNYGGYSNGGYSDNRYNDRYNSGNSGSGNTYGSGYNKSSQPSYNNAPASSQPGSDYPAGKADYTNKAAAAANDMDALDNAFSDEDLDISRDDLPF